MNTPTPRPLVPWGPQQAAIGIAAFIALLLATNLAALGLAHALGHQYRTRDIGDTFEKAARIASYSAERLAAARTGTPLPAPPDLLADQTSLQILFLVTAISQAAIIAIVGIATGLTSRQLLRALGFHHLDLAGTWRPAAAVLLAYSGTFAWVQLIDHLDITWLQPRSTVPIEITRDPLTLAIAAAVTLVGAPATEELFFRGLLFGGFSRWGFWPAALLSGALFALVHFDPGSIVPFLGIGIGLAWLYHRSHTLWHPILFHLLFNTISFSILALA